MKHILPSRPFYFIRHGQSEWNILNKFAGGQIDTPLTNEGRKQACEARKIFDNLRIKPDRIYHSHLSRAKETAIILNRNSQLPLFEINDLREIDAGEWTGLNSSIPKKKWEDGLKPEKGEGLNDFGLRIQNTFNKILNHYKEGSERPIIVAHGRILNAIDHLYQIAPRSLQAENCQILEFEPSIRDDRKYPWDVYGFNLINNKSQRTLMDWSQI